MTVAAGRSVVVIANVLVETPHFSGRDQRMNIQTDLDELLMHA